MINDDLPQFIGALLGLGELFNETLSERRQEAYFSALSDLPMDRILGAITHAARACKFFPKPAELREFVNGSSDDRAALAWTRFLRALTEVGTYQSVDFGDPALHATVEALGGWHEAWRIERLDAKDQGFKRAEFCRLYGALEGRGATIGAGPRRLVGQHEIVNHRAGHRSQVWLALIGADGCRIGPPASLPGSHEPAALEAR